jgi:beta-galactosidase
MGISVSSNPKGDPLRGSSLNGPGILIIDGLHTPDAHRYRSLQNTILERGGTVLVWGVDPGSAHRLNEYLPRPLELTTRKATSFLVAAPDPILNGLGNVDFYFSEISDSPVMNFGLAGDFTHSGNILLKACNTDWKTWNGRAEYLKTAAVLRSEREYKPEGAALVSQHVSKGKIYVLALDPAVLSKTSVSVLRKLFINLGLSFQNTARNNLPAIDPQGQLQQALLLASFDIAGKSNEEIRAIDLLKGFNEHQFFAGHPMNDRYWEKATAHDGIFDFSKFSFTGPFQNAIAYLSFWIYSPRSLSNLLVEPDMPRVDLFIGADDACQVFLNRKLIHESFTGGFTGKGEPIRALPLEKGWNHILIKAIQKGGAWKLAVGLDSDNKEFLKEIKSQIAR